MSTVISIDHVTLKTSGEDITLEVDGTARASRGISCSEKPLAGLTYNMLTAVEATFTRDQARRIGDALAAWGRA